MSLPDDAWDSRSYPGQYTPVQLGPTFPLPLGFWDWWGPRSLACCCCWPGCRCLAGRCDPRIVEIRDIADPGIWGPSLQLPTTCPEEMQGIWWLQDNIAAETLVSFNDADWSVDDKGIWTLKKPLAQTWSRHHSTFGYVLACFNGWHGWRGPGSPWADSTIYWNFKEGKARFPNDREWAFKIDGDEWQKPGYNAKPGQPGGDVINYMYRWRRVIRADGSTTPAFEELKAKVTSPYPHTTCCYPWCPCWPVGLTKVERLADMNCPNRYQIIIFPKEARALAQASKQATEQAMEQAPEQANMA